MTHTNEESMSERMSSLDMRNRDEIIEFCAECYSHLTKSSWNSFIFKDFVATLPSKEEYMQAGDYTGATAKIGLDLFASFFGGYNTDSLVAEIDGWDFIKSVPIMEDESADFIANILGMIVARTASHVSSCDDHDISNPYAFFGEVRYALAQTLYDVGDKYLSVSKNLGVLMITAMKEKGVGYIEKNPILTYHLNAIEKMLDEAPIPATHIGMQASNAMTDLKKNKENYPAYSVGLLAAAMVCIQFGVVDITTAKSLNESVINFVNALQEVA